MIAPNVIEQVKLRANIQDVVSDYAKLQGHGYRLKACCPFHEEKTPSFFVNINTNTWHCFGGCSDGGDVISFVQKKHGFTFDEAVRHLANRYGIPIEEVNQRERTAEQQALETKREALFVIYSAVQKYFVQCFHAPTIEAGEVRKYAYERFGEKYCEEIGIGYALNSWDGLLTYARQNALSVELMKEVGLLSVSEKNGRTYDFFRQRLMIPIRDRYGRVIGYSARTMSNEDTAKYINSRTSLLYNKDKSVFGLDIAMRQASRDRCFYLVEGAPDVLKLQSIGVSNTIACLGSDWTDHQFELLQRYADRLCFLPDADTPKAGDAFGTGIKKVIKAGKRAVEMKFKVSVREIPLGEGGQKHDPCSYCKSMAMFQDLKEEDFILWLAKKRLAETVGTENNVSIFEEIAELVSLCEKEHEVEMYLTELNKIIKGKVAWKKAIDNARHKRSEKELKENKQNILYFDLFEKFGFQEQGNTYISIGSNGKPVRWSNFILRPLFHIKDNQSALRLFEIRNEDGMTDIVEFKQEDLVSLAKFKQRIESLGNYVWLVKDEQLTRLKQFLYKTTDSAELITQLGWQPKGFFAFGNGVFYKNIWYKVDDFGIVKLPEKGNFYLPAFSRVYRDDTQFFQFERNFVHLNYGKITLHDYCKQLVDVFGKNAMEGIAFLFATLFRDIITAHTKFFPILNLFGPKGSGKSELGHSLMSFFIIGNTPPNLQNSTLPALADTVAQCANALVHIDEFKNSIDIDKREFLKGLWDGTGRNRMNMDRDKKREVTKVSCGVILSGQEMATADIALFSRFIFLSYDKSEFSPEAQEKFRQLEALRKLGCSHLVMQLLTLRPKVEQDFRSSYEQTFSDLQELLKNRLIEDRIMRNWHIPLAVFHCIEDQLQLPFSYQDLLKFSFEGIVRQNTETKSNNEISQFWDIVTFLRQEGQIYIGADYRLEWLTELRTDGAKLQKFQSTKQVLYLRYKHVIELYHLHGAKTKEPLLPKTSLMYYLESAVAYLGKKRSVRFKNIIRGVQQTTAVHTYNSTELVEETVLDQAYCFDYEMLQSMYGISLEVSNINEQNDE